MSILEAIMMLCFGAAWPFSIYRSWKSHSTQGKSLFFLVILLVGYSCGIANKILFSFDYVVWLYALNMVMVSIDTFLWLRNNAEEKAARTVCTADMAVEVAATTDR